MHNPTLRISASITSDAVETAGHSSLDETLGVQGVQSVYAIQIAAAIDIQRKSPMKFGHVQSCTYVL